MKKIKKYGISIIIMIMSFFISSILLTILRYFDIVNDKTLSILEIVSMIIIMFIGGFLTGNKSNQKGWLEGLKIGISFFIIFSLINIIIIHNFNIKTLFYYLILLVPSILGGMIGILKK